MADRGKPRTSGTGRGKPLGGACLPAEASVGAGILCLETVETMLEEGLACCEARFRVEEVGLRGGEPLFIATLYF